MGQCIVTNVHFVSDYRKIPREWKRRHTAPDHNPDSIVYYRAGSADKKLCPAYSRLFVTFIDTYIQWIIALHAVDSRHGNIKGTGLRLTVKSSQRSGLNDSRRTCSSGVNNCHAAKSTNKQTCCPLYRPIQLRILLLDLFCRITLGYTICVSFPMLLLNVQWLWKVFAYSYFSVKRFWSAPFCIIKLINYNI